MTTSRAGAFELVAPTFTPLGPGGSISVKPIERYAEYLLSHGITTAFVNGSTGESLSLTVEERKLMAEAWKKASNGRLRIILHVGHNCLPEAIELARHAQETQVDAIAAIAPNFFRPESSEELVDFLAIIADEASDTPFYFYYMPRLTGVHLDVVHFLRLATGNIKSFAGMKYTHDDLVEFGTIMSEWGEQREFYYGCDNLLLPSMCLGATGAIGTAYNLIPDTFTALVKAWSEKRLADARQLQLQANRFIDVILRYGLLPYGKRLLSLLLAEEFGQVRLPLAPCSDENFSAFLKDIERLGHASSVRPPHYVLSPLSLARQLQRAPVSMDRDLN